MQRPIVSVLLCTLTLNLVPLNLSLNAAELDKATQTFSRPDGRGGFYFGHDLEWTEVMYRQHIEARTRATPAHGVVRFAKFGEGKGATGRRIKYIHVVNRGYNGDRGADVRIVEGRIGLSKVITLKFVSDKGFGLRYDVYVKG